MKKNKGSIVIFVVVAGLFFVAFLMNVLVLSASKSRSQTQATKQMEKIYNSGNQAQVYQSLMGGNTVPIYSYKQLEKMCTGELYPIPEENGKIYNFASNATYVLKDDLEFDYSGIWQAPSFAEGGKLDENGHTIKIKNTLTSQYYYVNVPEYVIFDADGGTVPIASKAVSYGEAYGELPTPVKDGYTFLGWNGKNLFNRNIINENHYATNTGEIKSFSSSSSPWDCSDYIKVEGGKTYTFNPNTTAGNGSPRHVIYDEDKNYIDDVDSGLATITMPENARYLVTSFRSENSPSNPASDIQLEEGEYATEYEPYFITSSTIVTQTRNHTLKAIWEEAE